MQIDHLDVIRNEVDRILELVRAVDLDSPTTSCPGWTVRDLVVHLGGVHRWATAAVRLGPEDPPPGVQASTSESDPSELDNAHLAAWFAEGAELLLAALGEGSPTRPCWTIAPPRTVAFWIRRQAHETTVHRWDLELAAGAPGRVANDVALDGIDEVLTVLVPRQVRLGRLAATSRWVRLQVGVEFYDLTTGGRAEPPLATVQGSAHDLLMLMLMLLWGRGDESVLHVDGDRNALAELLRGAITP